MDTREPLHLFLSMLFMSLLMYFYGYVLAVYPKCSQSQQGPAFLANDHVVGMFVGYIVPVGNVVSDLFHEFSVFHLFDVFAVFVEK